VLLNLVELKHNKHLKMIQAHFLVDLEYMDLLELQLHVADTASVGTLTAETLTFAYDES
jgi:hypothetical protein